MTGWQPRGPQRAPRVRKTRDRLLRRHPSALVVEGLPLCRQALMRLLSKVLGVKAFAGGSAPHEMWSQLRQTKADLLVLDRDLLSEDVFGFLPWVPRLAPGCRVIFMMTCVTARDLLLASRDPVAAFLPKMADAECIEQVFRAVLRGETLAPRASEEQSWHPWCFNARDAHAHRAASLLSKLECDVLVRLARRLPVQQIAEELSLSSEAVNRAQCQVMDKLGIDDQVTLARFAIRERLMDP